MNNLIEFPTRYIPSNAEYERLWSWQLAIRGWRRQLVHDWDMAGFDGYHRAISKEKFHQGVRNNWVIHLGYKDTLMQKILGLQK